MSDGSGHVRPDKCQNVGWDLVTPKSGVGESWDARLGCQCGGYGQALDAGRAGAKCQGQATGNYGDAGEATQIGLRRA
jgi:hypothetical protein